MRCKHDGKILLHERVVATQTFVLEPGKSVEGAWENDALPEGTIEVECAKCGYSVRGPGYGRAHERLPAWARRAWAQVRGETESQGRNL